LPQLFLQLPGKGVAHRDTVERSGVERFSVKKKQMPELGLAQPDSVLEHCIENGFKLAGDELITQHLGGSSPAPNAGECGTGSRP
jgi:hypothetical protein